VTYGAVNRRNGGNSLISVAPGPLAVNHANAMPKRSGSASFAAIAKAPTRPFRSVEETDAQAHAAQWQERQET
jgi:hypothetical protein